MTVALTVTFRMAQLGKVECKRRTKGKKSENWEVLAPNVEHSLTHSSTVASLLSTANKGHSSSCLIAATATAAATSDTKHTHRLKFLHFFFSLSLFLPQSRQTFLLMMWRQRTSHQAAAAAQRHTQLGQLFCSFFSLAVLMWWGVLAACPNWVRPKQKRKGQNGNSQFHWKPRWTFIFLYFLFLLSSSPLPFYGKMSSAMWWIVGFCCVCACLKKKKMTRHCHTLRS